MQDFELARLKNAVDRVAAARRRLEGAEKHLLQVASADSLVNKLRKAVISTTQLEHSIRNAVFDEMKGRQGNG